MREEFGQSASCCSGETYQPYETYYEDWDLSFDEPFQRRAEFYSCCAGKVYERKASFITCSGPGCHYIQTDIDLYNRRDGIQIHLCCAEGTDIVQFENKVCEALYDTTTSTTSYGCCPGDVMPGDGGFYVCCEYQTAQQVTGKDFYICCPSGSVAYWNGSSASCCLGDLASQGADAYACCEKYSATPDVVSVQGGDYEICCHPDEEAYLSGTTALCCDGDVVDIQGGTGKMCCQEGEAGYMASSGQAACCNGELYHPYTDGDGTESSAWECCPEGRDYGAVEDVGWQVYQDYTDRTVIKRKVCCPYGTTLYMLESSVCNDHGYSLGACCSQPPTREYDPSAGCGPDSDAYTDSCDPTVPPPPTPPEEPKCKSFQTLCQSGDDSGYLCCDDSYQVCRTDTSYYGHSNARCCPTPRLEQCEAWGTEDRRSDGCTAILYCCGLCKNRVCYGTLQALDICRRD